MVDKIKIHILKEKLSTGEISLSEAKEIIKASKPGKKEYNNIITEFEEVIRAMLEENENQAKIYLDRREP